MAMDSDGSGFFNRREFERALNALGLIFIKIIILVTCSKQIFSNACLAHLSLLNKKFISEFIFI